MGRKLQISIVFVVLASILGAVMIYLWDNAYENQIAEGVTIGGVDVGGLESDAAASQIRTSLVRPLERNVVVTYKDEKFKLEPKELDIRANVNGMVADALDASQEGGILVRTARRVSGEEVDHSVKPTISYSKQAVSSFVEGVAAKLDRDAQDASVSPSGATLQTVAAQSGRTVEQTKLRKGVERALQSPNDREVAVKVDKVKPEVTTDQLAAAYPTYLVVDRPNFKLYLYKDLELAKTYTVAVGQVGYDTPAGQYEIQTKQVDPVWTVPNSDWAGDLAGETVPPGPDNPLKARWLGVNGSVGIHGTSDAGSLGSSASHGCIRMGVSEVVELYDRVPTGTPVYIA